MASAQAVQTHIDGRPVEIPATIEGIRATLDAVDVDRYDAEIRRTPAQELHRVLARWALPAEAEAEDDAAIARLAAGDFSGCAPQHEDHTERRELIPHPVRGPGRGLAAGEEARVRSSFEASMTKTLGAGLYGHGSTSLKGNRTTTRRPWATRSSSTTSAPRS